MFGHHKIEEHRVPVETTDQLASDAGRMYWLALVLTDEEKLAASLTQENIEQLVTGDPVFVRWMGNWSRRIIMKACVAAKRAELAADRRNPDSWDAAAAQIEIDHPQPFQELSINSIQSSTRSLPLLPRFLFVMNALEGYSPQDAAQLLQTPRSTCEAALKYAFVAITAAIHSPEHASRDKRHSLA